MFNSFFDLRLSIFHLKKCKKSVEMVFFHFFKKKVTIFWSFFVFCFNFHLYFIFPKCLLCLFLTGTQHSHNSPRAPCTPQVGLELFLLFRHFFEFFFDWLMIAFNLPFFGYVVLRLVTLMFPGPKHYKTPRKYLRSTPHGGSTHC